MDNAPATETTAAEMAALIGHALTETEQEVRHTASFEEASVLTYDAGVVVTMADGSTFYVTVVAR